MDKKIIANNIFNTNFNHTLHAYIDIAGGLVEGTLLSQIMYWFSTGRDGKLRAKIIKNGEVWIVKSRTEWWDEIRISPKQYDRAIKKLAELDLVVLGKWKFNGMPAIHIRPNYEGLGKAVIAWKKQQIQMLENAKNDDVETTKQKNANAGLVEMGVTKRDTSNHTPKGNIGVDQRGTLLTETTNRDYTKNTKNPIYAQTDACASVGGKQISSSEKKSEKKQEIEQRKKELTDMFEEFWKIYPKKKNKVAAKHAFLKVAPDKETFMTILKAVHVAIRSYDWRKDNGQYIPYPSSWLNGRRWEDEQSVGVEPMPAVPASTAISTHTDSRPVYGNNIAMQSLQRAAESPNADVDYSTMSPEDYMALEDAVWNEKK